jgi:hypothetical protein
MTHAIRDAQQALEAAAQVAHDYMTEVWCGKSPEAVEDLPPSIRALSARIAPVPEAVAGLVERLRDGICAMPSVVGEMRLPDYDSTIALMAQAADLFEAQARELARLRGALFAADDALMQEHGCFPLDQVTEPQRRLHRAATLIRAITGEDHAIRKSIADRLLADAAQGDSHE